MWLEYANHFKIKIQYNKTSSLVFLGAWLHSSLPHRSSNYSETTRHCVLIRKTTQRRKEQEGFWSIHELEFLKNLRGERKREGEEASGAAEAVCVFRAEGSRGRASGQAKVGTTQA